MMEKLKVRNVGVFEIHTLAELEHLANDEDSPLRLKLK